MDSELLLKFIGYFLDYLSALSRTRLRFFRQPLSKQLYTLQPYLSLLVNNGVDISNLKGGATFDTMHTCCVFREGRETLTI